MELEIGDLNAMLLKSTSNFKFSNSNSCPLTDIIPRNSKLGLVLSGKGGLDGIAHSRSGLVSIRDI